MFRKYYSYLCVIAGLLLTSCSSGLERNTIAITPTPVKTTAGYGHLEFKETVTIGVSDDTLLPAAQYIESLIGHVVTVSVEVTNGSSDIYLELIEDNKKEGSYSLNISSKAAVIKASSYEGIISGIASMHQLLPVDLVNLTSSSELKLPIAAIEDAPRLGWRGMMMDSSRHFWDVDEVKQFIDLMALYKLNKFHWHLTDDQGWRIEIKKYPLLTEKGAWREYNSHDKTCMNLAKKEDNPDYNIPQDKTKEVDGKTLYGGYYTQDELHEIVAYAAQRSIDVIPEVDMPGHFLAAITQYPELACDGLIGWGDTFSSPICPGKDATLEFCKDVYREVFEIFPYEFVHLGGDEVEKNNWEKCAQCQARIKAEGLKDEEALQAWFVREMESFFNANGKRLIGWDEVVADGLSEKAAIMWWRSWNPSAIPTATAEGKNVINTMNVNLYFDYEQDSRTMGNLLAYDPILPELSDEQKNLILGVQANCWAEWIPTQNRLQYMTTPRILALSEIAWVEPENILPIDEFYSSVIPQFHRFDAMRVNYRIPDLEGFYDINVFVDEAVLDVTCALPNAIIRYTTDGSMPNAASALYEGPITITESTDFTFRTFRGNGTASDVFKTKYVKSEFIEPAADAVAENEGLQVKRYEYRGSTCAAIDEAEHTEDHIVETVSIPEGVTGNIGLVITGYLDIPADDIYTFSILSDDGSTLKVHGDMVIDNDGAHSPQEVTAQIALKKGLHPIEVRYFDHNGGVLSMHRIDKEGNKEVVSKDWFKH